MNGETEQERKLYESLERAVIAKEKSLERIKYGWSSYTDEDKDSARMEMWSHKNAIYGIKVYLAEVLAERGVRLPTYIKEKGGERLLE